MQKRGHYDDYDAHAWWTQQQKSGVIERNLKLQSTQWLSKDQNKVEVFWYSLRRVTVIEMWCKSIWWWKQEQVKTFMIKANQILISCLDYDLMSYDLNE